MLQARRRGRPGAGRRLRELAARIRDRVPGVVLRSSFIVGFPGESDEDFTELLDFLRDCRFERVGVFRYSHEEGTAAFGLDGQVPEKTKEARRARAMKLQARIARAANLTLVGEELPVLVCGQLDNGQWYGRTQGQAADIDGVVLLRGRLEWEAGAIVSVKITRASTYDLEAAPLSARPAAESAPAR
jgi:ribosomal protein S12 methylthiotransferase